VVEVSVSARGCAARHEVVRVKMLIGDGSPPIVLKPMIPK
jgi:hypothetical protein